MADWARFGAMAWDLMKKYWPLALSAWQQLEKFVRDHPEVPEALRNRIDGARERFAAAQDQRTPENRIKGTLDAVRRITDEDSDEDLRAFSSDEVADLRRRVQSVERALDLATVQKGDARRTMLRKVTKQTDALAAEVFMALIPDTADASGDVIDVGDDALDGESPEGGGRAVG